MSKCNKTKNPCKICLTPVSRKTGLQCEGACKSWVHYSCLNYTPGKISDIKAGIIKITCPCPDCRTNLPKEYRTDQPYSCNNSMCPANKPPKCDNFQCPTNSGGRQMPQGQPCALNKCGTQCKEFSSPNLPDNRVNHQCPPPTPCKPVAEITSDACISANKKCPSGCSSANNVSGDFGGKPPKSEVQSPNFAVVEEMCRTVGELSDQIKELVCEIKQGKQAVCGGGAPNKASGGGKEPCPCFCPGNPARRM